MSDKPLVQQALASELAELILTISSTTASLAFIRGFWEMTVREWNGIDRVRYVFIQCIRFYIDLFVELTSIICSYVASLTQPFAFSSERDGTRMSAKNITAFYPMRGDLCGEYRVFFYKVYKTQSFSAPVTSGFRQVWPTISLIFISRNLTKLLELQRHHNQPLLVPFSSLSSVWSPKRQRAQLINAYNRPCSNHFSMH